MTTAEFVNEVVLLSEGKLQNFPVGSTKWNRVVGIGNFYLRQFAKEKGIQWGMFYTPEFSLGTVTAGLKEVALDDDIYDISRQFEDPLRIKHSGSDNETHFTFVNPQELQRYKHGDYCAKLGRFVRFNRTFTADNPEIGGEIVVPVHVIPDPFSKEKEEIPAEIGEWLVLATAADRVKNDVTRRNLRQDLVSQANQAMLSIQEKNEGQLSEVSTPWNPTSHLTDDWNW